MGPRAKWIINYPNIPDKWPVKLGSSLSQLEITALELDGFVLDDSTLLENSAVSKDPVTANSSGSEDLGNASFSPPKMPLKFNLDCFSSPLIAFPNQMQPTMDGDKRPILWNGRPIRFVSCLSSNHLKKMDDNRSLSYTIMKYVKVPSPGYGLVLILCTLGSVERKELYEVSILNYPSCSCLDFKFMKARANWKRKWMPYKHLYFVI